MNSTSIYITQDWLDEFSGIGNGSPGNPDSGGNGCDRVCANADPDSAAFILCGCDGGSGEPASNIDQWTTGVLLFIFSVCLFILIRSGWRIKQAKKSNTDWYKKWLNENYPDKTLKQ